MISRELKTGWQFKQTDSQEWMPVARVPTNVHLDLIANKRIEDPFIDTNELHCQWVAETSWTYRADFDIPIEQIHGDETRVVLAFDGLDTYTTVKLNGITILESDNMFIMHRVDIIDHALLDSTNVLQIEFKSALLESRKIKEAHPDHKWVGSNGDMARLAARKAQYHYGWDWGPVLTTCGPWRPIRLETYETRISDVRIDYEMGSTLGEVIGSITAVVEGGHDASIEFRAKFEDTEVFRAVADVDIDGQARVEILIASPNLWYPSGYGKQNLYTVTVSLVQNGGEVHSVTQKVGFRKVELIQELDSIGKSFYFRVNGVDVFCGGSNWIPADSFTPRISTQKYRSLLEAIKDGNQTMVRVWGGGIWEDDAFYDQCDKLGILVWQDFMFACGNYPASRSFLRSVEQEATCQVKRLRHHPSIVVYAGNNEDYQIQEQFGLTCDWDDRDPQSWLKTDFPARYIYEKLLPDVVTTHSPQTLYHPGSPWGDGKRTSDPTVGDMHEWNVWHGTQEKYQRFGSLGGRFNSEFGMEAFPDLKTIQYFVTDSSQMYPKSSTMDFHNKAFGHEERIAKYVGENFRLRPDLEGFIYLTQLCQSEALSYAFKGWRKQWGQKHRCGGALVWQLNDCWPVTSWAIIDYFGRRKPAYYMMKRALAPIAIAVQREHYEWSAKQAKQPDRSPFECWVVSNDVKRRSATAELRFISIATGEDIKDKLVKENVNIAPNGTTTIFEGVITNTTEEPHIIAARLYLDDKVVCRDVDWPQPLKHLKLDDRGVTVRQESNCIHVEARRPTKGLVFEERDGVILADNALDLAPGETQIVKFWSSRPAEKPCTWTYLDAT